MLELVRIVLLPALGRHFGLRAVHLRREAQVRVVEVVVVRFYSHFEPPHESFGVLT